MVRRGTIHTGWASRNNYWWGASGVAHSMIGVLVRAQPEHRQLLDQTDERAEQQYPRE